MKPIFIFAIAAIAASGIGAAQLTNVIDITAQDFGVGSADIVSPITAANVDFTIEIDPNSPEGEFKNIVSACSFHSDESIEGEARIICKLTDAEHKVVAEGEIVVRDYQGSTTIPRIPITELAFPGANDVRNIHDVTLVVIGANPTQTNQTAP